MLHYCSLGSSQTRRLAWHILIQMLNHKWLKTRKVDGGMAPKRKSGQETPVIYVRQSSESNVGEGKHSDARQVDACTAYANIAGLQILTTFRDPGISGTDSLIARTTRCLSS
jgi:hypothetical protein